MSCFLWIMMQTRFTHFISFWCLLTFFSSVTAHFLLSSHLFSSHIFYWVSCTVEGSFPCVICNLIFCFPCKLTCWWTVNWSWGLETWLNSISYFLKAYTSYVMLITFYVSHKGGILIFYFPTVWPKTTQFYPVSKGSLLV